MVGSRSRLLWMLMPLALLGCERGAEILSPRPDVTPRGDATAEAEHEDWYPEEIDPPEGTEYPVRLTPLPERLDGLPAGDQGYLNHAFSQVLAVARANLAVLRALGTEFHEEGLRSYDDAVEEALQNLEAEEVPGGLEPFHGELLAALELQRAFVEKAGAELGALRRREGLEGVQAAAKRQEALNAVRRHSVEGQAARARLLSAWSHLARRYEGRWSPALRRCLYQHLQALQSL
ncbi:MAG: hypothetical protein D6731_21480 [Planctomycetota bacterium]|nr:MAG: hypothetical protein D6731_21480 [Planctomycetota bacterium]